MQNKLIKYPKNENPIHQKNMILATLVYVTLAWQKNLQPGWNSLK